MKNIKNKKGFTLIELIVVIAILGILMLILVPSFLGYANDAKEQVNKANARTLWTAAKAAETKSEYDSNIVVDTCGLTTGNPGSTTNTFCNEVAVKAGSVFDKKFEVEADTSSPKKVKSVTYVNGSVNCKYEPGTATEFMGCK